METLPAPCALEQPRHCGAPGQHTIAGDSPVEVMMNCQGYYQYQCSPKQVLSQHLVWQMAKVESLAAEQVVQPAAIVIQRAWRQYKRRSKQAAAKDTPWYAQGLPDEAHSFSMFTLVGRPHWYYVPRHRVWTRDIPLPWRRLRIKTPRGDCCLDAVEVQEILAGGFWRPSSSRQPDAPHPELSSLNAISSMMARHVKLLQREAEEVVQLLRDSRKKLAQSVKRTGRKLMSKGAWSLLCCCGPAAAATKDDDGDGDRPARPQVAHRAARAEWLAIADLPKRRCGASSAARSVVTSSDLADSLLGDGDYEDGSDDDDDSCSQTDLHEAAERQLKQRLSTNRLAATYAVLTWGRGDPLRTPLLAPVDSAADMMTHQDSR